MYEVATISRLLKIVGLFCRIQYSAKETNNFKESTNRSHPIHRHSEENKETKRVGRREGVGRGEGTRTHPDYLLDHAVVKIHGPLLEKV